MKLNTTNTHALPSLPPTMTTTTTRRKKILKTVHLTISYSALKNKK